MPTPDMDSTPGAGRRRTLRAFPSCLDSLSVPLCSTRRLPSHKTSPAGPKSLQLAFPNPDHCLDKVCPFPQGAGPNKACVTPRAQAQALCGVYPAVCLPSPRKPAASCPPQGPCMAEHQGLEGKEVRAQALGGSRSSVKLGARQLPTGPPLTWTPSQTAAARHPISHADQTPSSAPQIAHLDPRRHLWQA